MIQTLNPKVQKVSVGAGGEAYGITIDGNAKSAQ